mmetsp:Transcript_69953/g.160402  ORF Transcript_69953/g.160402 Transcript_69953/m.160402 type:complete len:185 (-) Transcript_69953:99-653(-)
MHARMEVMYVKLLKQEGEWKKWVTKHYPGQLRRGRVASPSLPKTSCAGTAQGCGWNTLFRDLPQTPRRAAPNNAPLTTCGLLEPYRRGSGIPRTSAGSGDNSPQLPRGDGSNSLNLRGNGSSSLDLRRNDSSSLHVGANGSSSVDPGNGSSSADAAPQAFLLPGYDPARIPQKWMRTHQGSTRG